jgi:hypothetical protein
MSAELLSVQWMLYPPVSGPQLFVCSPLCLLMLPFRALG